MSGVGLSYDNAVKLLTSIDQAFRLQHVQCFCFLQHCWSTQLQNQTTGQKIIIFCFFFFNKLDFVEYYDYESVLS